MGYSAAGIPDRLGRCARRMTDAESNAALARSLTEWTVRSVGCISIGQAWTLEKPSRTNEVVNSRGA